MLPFLRALNSVLVSLALFLGSFTSGVMWQTWQHGDLPLPSLSLSQLSLFPSPTPSTSLRVNPTLTPTSTPTPTATPTLFPTPSRSPTPSLSLSLSQISISPLPQSTSMPGEGNTRTRVVTDSGTFTLSCIGAAKGSVRVVTDSGNDSDCANDCTVLSLADYAARNGAFASMNGMYFCPADYAACSDKKNSFDTLFFNSRSRIYLNSDNNIYSTLPWLAIEGSGNPLFYRHTSEWGRDMGIQAGTSGNPLLIKDGANVVGEVGLDDKQRNVKGNRGAFVQDRNLIYLCTVSGATVPDSAAVYQALGTDNAINIDGGGSTALWLNGSYIYGPGRNIPTAILFVR